MDRPEGPRSWDIHEWAYYADHLEQQIITERVKSLLDLKMSEQENKDLRQELEEYHDALMLSYGQESK